MTGLGRVVCLLVATLVSLMTFVPQLSAQKMAGLSRGTVNIALANRQGIVLLTDSVQSSTRVDGPHYETPFQKLFVLDDQTVCSIAGFASEIGWHSAALDTDVTGIVADFRDQLLRQPIPHLETKLRAVGFMVGFYIDLIANRREVLPGQRPTAESIGFEIILAGYDDDKRPKLERLTIVPSVTLPDGNGQRYWSHTSTVEVLEVGNKLVSQLGGIKVISQDVIDHPERYGSDGIVARFADSRNTDGGEGLTLDEMVSLAMFIAEQTASQTQAVGPPYQFAVLSKNKIVKIDQPPFKNPPRPLQFVVVSNLKITGAINLLAAPDAHMLWIRMEFVGIQNPMLRPDGQFFYDCVVRDSLVAYGGGLTDFGNTNTVINSMIFPGTSVTSPSEMLRIMNAFKWSSTPPNTPPLPPTMGPR